MINGQINVPKPVNEPVLDYAPGSSAREDLMRQITTMRSDSIEIPIVVGGKALTSEEQFSVVCPHDYRHVLARVHAAKPHHVQQAVHAAKTAWRDWSQMDWWSRLAIFRKAADLLSTRYRAQLNAATMLAQSKTPPQAEIDAACELIDFLRFNPWYAARLMAEQPSSAPASWNAIDYRALEGFVFAVTPFNFTSISGNLPTAPAMLGNVVLWKPAEEATLASYYFMRVLQEAGLPDGIINLLPGSGPAIGALVLPHSDLAGVHFTGSTSTFQHIWQLIGTHIASYRNYPRIVGETGGKDFIIAHVSADPQSLVCALLRGAYEYQGQKCSAVSRAFLPRSIYERIRDQLVEEIARMRMGDPCDFANFLGALINRRAFDKVTGYLEYAQHSHTDDIIVGGERDDTLGYFVRPTLIEARDPNTKLLQEEIFGPVLSCFIYPDDQFPEVLDLCDRGSPYALTGGIFAQDRRAIELATQRLRYTAGNFYINDKPTGAVVGQQPFGGSRASGTNDKAGSMNNLLRWVSPRTIKENYLPPLDYRYPYMT
jgi:1-pyrroline-5-carboxylate dehydrogenase